MDAHLTVPEIESGLAAVIVLGGGAIALFAVVAMLRAGARAAARRLVRFGRAARRTIVARQGPELVAKRASRSGTKFNRGAV